MSRTAQEILEDALRLPADQRNWLIGHLLEEETEGTPEEIEAAWDAEIARRIQEIDSGAVKTVPLEDVLARMDARIAAKRRG
jgi:putative addiction module component (TIGR02574 family)